MSGQVGRAGVGYGHLREQQGGVDGFGRARAQHGGEDGTGGDIDSDGEFGARQTPVVEEGEDVQAGGVDLDLLAGPQRRGGGEGPSVHARGHLPHGPGGQFAGPGEIGDEPVQRGLGRRGHGGAVPVGKDLVDQREQAVDGALRAAAAAVQRLADGCDDPLVSPPGGAGGAGGAVVEQHPQALFAVGQAHALHRGARHPAEPERGQLLSLGLLPLG